MRAWNRLVKIGVAAICALALTGVVPQTVRAPSPSASGLDDAPTNVVTDYSPDSD